MQNRSRLSHRRLAAAFSISGGVAAGAVLLLAGAQSASAFPYLSPKPSHAQAANEPKVTITPDTPANHALYNALLKNDMMAIHAALDAGASPNATATNVSPEYSRTNGATIGYSVEPAEPLLKRAIGWREAKQTIPVFRLFLEHSLDVNVKSSDGTTPLFWAIALEDDALVRAVVERGADVNAPYPYALGGGNALGALMNTYTYPTEDAKMPLLNFLLDKGVDPNVYAPCGWTVLHSAAFFGKRQTLAVLLARGANPTAPVRSPANGAPLMIPIGSSPIQLAARTGYPGILPLLAKANPNLSPVDAAIAGQADALRRALDNHAASPNAVDNEGTPLLTLAARSGDAATVTVLLDRGAKTETRARIKGKTALGGVVVSESLEAVRVLLERHADPNAASAPKDDKDGYDDFDDYQSSLMTAICLPSPPIVELLLQHGALVHGPGKDADALRLAVVTVGRSQATRRGRAPQDKLSENALIEAQCKIFDLILAHSDVPRNGGRALATAAEQRRWGLAQILLDKNADVNARESGKTVLMLTIDSIGMHRIELLPETVQYEKLSEDELKKRQIRVAAANKPAVAFLKALLRRHPDLGARASGTNSGDDENQTALALAHAWTVLADVESLLRRAGARQ